MTAWNLKNDSLKPINDSLKSLKWKPENKLIAGKQNKMYNVS